MNGVRITCTVGLDPEVQVHYTNYKNTYTQIPNVEYKMQGYSSGMTIRTRSQFLPGSVLAPTGFRCKKEDYSGTVRSNNFFEQCSSQELQDEDHCLLKGSYYEDIMATLRGLFNKGQNNSLEESQALKASLML
jgi:hypothetical protein